MSKEIGPQPQFSKTLNYRIVRFAKEHSDVLNVEVLALMKEAYDEGYEDASEEAPDCNSCDKRIREH